MATVVLVLIAATEAWLVTDGIRRGVTTAIGIDFNQYLAHTRRWLDWGEWPTALLPVGTAWSGRDLN